MTEAELARLLDEYQALARTVEQQHPGCLRRSDRWSSGTEYVHGIIGGRRCPASSAHRRRREVLARYVELFILPSPEPSAAGA